RWAAIPVFILMAGLLGYMVLIRGTEAASAELLPIVGSMVAVTIFWSAADRLRAEEEQLRRERREVASGAVSGARCRLQHPELASMYSAVSRRCCDGSRRWPSDAPRITRLACLPSRASLGLRLGG